MTKALAGWNVSDGGPSAGQNSEATPKCAPHLRQYHFQQGQSGNPGGRPKGIVNLIRERTHDGADLVEYWLQVFHDKRARRRDRLACATELADRGFGKPVQAVLHGGPDGGAIPMVVGLSQLTDAELVEFIRRGMRAVVVEGTVAALSDGDEKATSPQGPDGKES